MKFDELNKNLMDVLVKLISSQNLCKLLTYTDSDPLGLTTTKADIADTSTLLFNKIYPIPKIPDIQDVEGSLITVIFEDIRLSGNTGFKDSILCFNVFSHIDIWKINDALRPYSIMGEIDKLFNNQRVIGLGRVQFSRSRFIMANPKYMGFRLDYSVVDFN